MKKLPPGWGVSLCMAALVAAILFGWGVGIYHLYVR